MGVDFMSLVTASYGVVGVGAIFGIEYPVCVLFVSTFQPWAADAVAVDVGVGVPCNEHLSLRLVSKIRVKSGYERTCLEGNI